MEQWFNAGVTCVGMGSNLISKDILASQDFEKLENIVRETLTLIQQIRKVC